MPGNPIVVYAQQPFPDQTTQSIFLAGPTPRRADVPSWRPEAISLLRELGYNGLVFVPEDHERIWRGDYVGQVEWEEEGLERCDVVVFWIPREISTMPAFTTNDEWGHWKDSNKVVLGYPETAEKISYQSHYAKKLDVPLHHTLRETLQAAMHLIGDGALRTGPECKIPYLVWKTHSFQQWYRSLVANGNELRHFRLLWSHELFKQQSEKKFVFSWIALVTVFVTEEQREKTNEFVFSRSDVSAIVAYRKRENLLDTEILMVKEFRSPVSNATGYVHELPGGSAPTDREPDYSQWAIEELQEEAGLSLHPDRLKFHGLHQVAATLASYKAALFSVELTEQEIEAVKQKSAGGVVLGNTEDSERTYPQVSTLKFVLSSEAVDLATRGMIAQVLLRPQSQN